MVVCWTNMLLKTGSARWQCCDVSTLHFTRWNRFLTFWFDPEVLQFIHFSYLVFFLFKEYKKMSIPQISSSGRWYCSPGCARIWQKLEDFNSSFIVSTSFFLSMHLLCRMQWMPVNIKMYCINSQINGYICNIDEVFLVVRVWIKENWYINLPWIL